MGPWTGPNVGGLPVHLPPQCTPWTTPTPLQAPIPLLAHSLYTPCQPPMHPWHLLHPLMVQTLPQCSYTLWVPNAPLITPIPLQALSPYTLCQSPMHPDTPTPLMAPNTPTSPPMPPDVLYIPAGPWGHTLPASLLMHPMPSLNTPWHPLHPC